MFLIAVILLLPTPNIPQEPKDTVASAIVALNAAIRSGNGDAIASSSKILAETGKKSALEYILAMCKVAPASLYWNLISSLRYATSEDAVGYIQEEVIACRREDLSKDLTLVLLTHPEPRRSATLGKLLASAPPPIQSVAIEEIGKTGEPSLAAHLIRFAKTHSQLSPLHRYQLARALKALLGSYPEGPPSTWEFPDLSGTPRIPPPPQGRGLP